MILADKIISLRKKAGWSQEAAAYLTLSWQNAPRVALATLLCILSPIVLLLLGGVSRLPGAPLREEAAIGVGLAVLLGMVAVGVGLFIACDAKMEDFRFLEKAE